MRAALREEVEAWIAGDPDPSTRAELQGLLDAGDEDALAERFSGPLRFGTAGLRAPVRGGPQGLNRAVARRTAAGLAAHLGPGTTVVLGRDARHGSEAFCADAAAVLAGAGVRALVLPRPLPTPVVAYAVLRLGADAGLMVTASHNPPADNGLKVFVADGAQLPSPEDAALEAAIDAVGPAAELPLGEPEPLGQDLVDAYVAAVVAASRVPDRDVTVAYTPMHGVGLETVRAVFAAAGLPEPVVVPEQAAPDPDFPTVSFPNPEEPGALDLLLATAARSGADVGIASDPDADRTAVTVGDRVLRGDEIGVLVADHLLSTGVRGRVATTIVSSSMLSRIAAYYGVPCAETLTGFKNLARADAGGGDLVYAYEEALGLCVDPARVRDKDGMSAALLVAELAALEKARGRTLLDRLADLEARHGRHETRQLSYRVSDVARIRSAVEDLRADPPAAYGERAVVQVETPAADVLVHRLDGGRVVVRPSGTEPKLKAYLELVDPAPGAMDALAEAVDARLALR